MVLSLNTKPPENGQFMGPMILGEETPKFWTSFFKYGKDGVKKKKRHRWNMMAFWLQFPFPDVLFFQSRESGNARSHSWDSKQNSVHRCPVLLDAVKWPAIAVWTCCSHCLASHLMNNCLWLVPAFLWEWWRFHSQEFGNEKGRESRVPGNGNSTYGTTAVN